MTEPHITRPAPGLFCILLGALTAAPLNAEDWIDPAVVNKSCMQLLEDPEAVESRLCIAFVQGFLAGTDATAASLRPPRYPIDDDETFRERAIRTRLGNARLLRRRSATGADFCIRDTDSAADILREVAAFLEAQADEPSLTDSPQFREALVAQFPCSQ